MQKTTWSVIFGVIVIIAFFALLLIRLEFFQKIKEPAVTLQSSRSDLPRKTWMSIYQNNKKIGFIRREFNQQENKFHFSENIFMQMNTMGISQAINISTDGYLHPDMSLDSFTFNLNSGIFNFNAHGYVDNKILTLLTGAPGAQQKSEIPLKDIPHITGNIYETAFRANMGKDAIRSFNIFDPSTMSLRVIKVSRKADEIITIMGKRILTNKYCTDFMGAQNCAWLSKEGAIVKETGMMGISMEQVSEGKAREGLAEGQSIDFNLMSSIPSNINISDPDNLRVIKLKITGMNNSLFINGDRQRYHGSLLTITKENSESSSNIHSKTPEEISLYLKPSPLIQSNDPQIKTLVSKIIKSTDSNEHKAKKIINWVYANIEKKPTLSVPNALDVLKNKSGDCNEHSALTVAMLRAAGIPAQMEAGLVYLQGRFYYHAWCVFFSGKWITADSAFNQIPADVTHIRLIRGDVDQQINLIGVIGKIKLEVMEQVK